LIQIKKRISPFEKRGIKGDFWRLFSHLELFSHVAEHLPSFEVLINRKSPPLGGLFLLLESFIFG
jgi:hypothetical protein